MKPDTFLSRVPREQLNASMQAAFDRSMTMHEDATFVEVMGHAPAQCDEKSLELSSERLRRYI